MFTNLASTGFGKSLIMKFTVTNAMIDEIEKLYIKCLNISEYFYSFVFSNEECIFPSNFTISAVNDWSSHYQPWIHSGQS